MLLGFSLVYVTGVVTNYDSLPTTLNHQVHWDEPVCECTQNMCRTRLRLAASSLVFWLWIPLAIIHNPFYNIFCLLVFSRCPWNFLGGPSSSTLVQSHWQRACSGATTCSSAIIDQTLNQLWLFISTTMQSNGAVTEAKDQQLLLARLPRLLW